MRQYPITTFQTPNKLQSPITNLRAVEFRDLDIGAWYLFGDCGLVIGDYRGGRGWVNG